MRVMVRDSQGWVVGTRPPTRWGRGLRRGVVVAIAVVLASAVLAPGAAAVVIGQDPGTLCVNGWATAGSPSAIAGSTAVDVTVQNGTEWVAGSANQEGPTFLAYAARSTAQGWSNVTVASTAARSLLTGIAASGQIGLWTSGERVGGGMQTQPLIEHYNGKTWTQSRVPSLRYGGALSDITQVGPQLAIAVGFGADLKGQHAIAYAWRRGGWALDSPRVTGFSALTGVSTAPDSTTWAVGWIQTADGYRPLLERWNGKGWTRASITGDGSLVLTGVDVLSKRSAWATGFREVAGTLSGVIAHWDGHSWAVDPGLTISATGGSILRGVAVIDGNVTAVGESWDQSAGYKDSLPLVAERVDNVWTASAGVAGITGGELLGITDGPNPLAVGRAGGQAIAIVPCTPGHAPTGSSGLVGGIRGSKVGLPAVAGVGVGVGKVNKRSPDIGTVADAALPASEAARIPKARQTSRRPTTGVVRRSLPSPRRVPGLQVEDVTAQAGLSATTLSFNGVSADLNGDGWPDLVIGRRARPLQVLLNQTDGTFEPVDNAFRQADRHGCAVGTIGPSPGPAIVCAIGASHGLGIKDNEVWLDPLDPTSTNSADALGLADPLGRGRQTALLDYNHDGLTDVYFGNDPSRPDALPGSNHLFRNVGGTSFEPAPEAGLDLGVGSQCLIPVDIDHDGWTDLIDCEYIQMAAYSALHIFHNNHGVFTDVTARLGINGQDVFDAAVGDLNHDGRADLVTLAPGRMDVWLQSGGTFHDRLAMWVPHAVAVTLADVNGDGRPDIYLVRGQEKGPAVQDVLLLNNGDGTRFTSVRLPSLQPGPGGAAVAIDYDRNGKQDILVMHGNNVREGPVQLLAFGPPWPMTAPGVEATPTPTPMRSAQPSLPGWPPSRVAAEGTGLAGQPGS